MGKPRILLVDDNQAFLDLFMAQPECAAFDVTPLDSPRRALRVMSKEPVDLVVTDVQMPEMSGIELFSLIQDTYPEVPVILITAFGSLADAVAAVKGGAYHYFEKPLNDKMDLFWRTVEEAIAKKELLREIGWLRQERIRQRSFSDSLIGRSPAVKQVLNAIREVADLPVTVLICGETGTGKGVVARMIHDTGNRGDHPFLAANCSAFAPGVLESELFGHEKGAFTGAIEQRVGIFEAAHRGTLLLDEISETPLPLQAKLLTVIEEKTFSRVGGTSAIRADFRLLAATHRNLDRWVEKGRFRQDLLYRLKVYVIDLPALRHRREDILPIAEYYLEKFCRDYAREVTGFSEKAMAALRAYDWPGNVREVVNVVERAVITCREPLITNHHLPFDTEEDGRPTDLNLKELEKFHIELALRRTGNNRTKAAELLGIARKTLIEKIRKYTL